MQRKAYAPVAALAAALLTVGLASGCSSGSGTTGSGDDAKSRDSSPSATAAQPGKYQSLPEPCGKVDRKTLRTMLPGVDDQSDQDAEKTYAGQPNLTYDTDRRVGCRWSLETPDGTRHIAVDYERVVSYDPAVSDDDRARQLYEARASAANIPTGSSTGHPPGHSAGNTSAGNGSAGSSTPQNHGSSAQLLAEGDADTSPTATPGTPTTPSAPASPTANAADLAPRLLNDLGDDAFLNDRLASTDSGVHRDITIVFRSSNVLVTVGYDQWAADKHHTPSSEDLQSKARGLAHELAEHFSD
ncbi:hypothetical protein ACFU99_13580 [Streptomyces sp. NPDC057654]|uniref:hypothetical protein n=1 Tax=Streptomyces sp. NPDC057654 TaxID=3346196 RepID=UPI00369D8AF1